ncbi:MULTISPECIES: rhomboid family intramembrane serine protease [Kitasatospora]|uniref:Putative peptidase S54 family protein n=1 Tax=Kitasatospora setae (strain ATCC 33774 / DSM 43861 / JCM 3304 / KCC A-0304 / NBRC 14216 / KM-6054) TaxID=452652 RepID=E4NDE6_KITSK|nr:MULTISPECIES: rhomboid family intramembrane serine protease [Kitasatospora]BAJ29227.1 putative peptidase S54 family protein [Kitasatospora setae KM-6054]
MASSHDHAPTGGGLDPAQLIAEARRAFFVMFSFMCLVWAAQLVNWLLGGDMARQHGIVPHDPDTLGYLLTAPFLHANWQHLEGNSGPLFVFGFLAAYRGVGKFLGLTALLVVTSGMTVWLFQDGDTVTVGASGLVYGYLGYGVLRGLFDRNLIDSLIGLVMGASFAYVLTAAVPGTPGVSWLGHLGGLVGGLAGAWIFRDRRPGRPAGLALRSGRSGSADDARSLPAPGRPAAAPAGPVSPRADLLKELDDLGL